MDSVVSGEETRRRGILLESSSTGTAARSTRRAEILEQKHGAATDPRQLRTMLAQLPRRSPRRFEGDDGLSAVPSPDGADSQLSDRRT